MRPESDRLHDLTDGAGAHQLPCSDRRAILEPLAVHDRVDAPRLGLDLSNLGQLLERRNARLVDHEVLAVFHDADAERRPLVRDGGADHELNRLVLENLGLAASDLRLRKTLDERRAQIRFFRKHRDELAAAANDRFGLPVDVAMVEADDGKLDFGGRLPGTRCGESGRRQGGNRRRRSGNAADELTPAHARSLHVVAPEVVMRTGW